MQKNIFRKGLVLGIIFLLIGASVTTITGINIKNYILTEKNKINAKVLDGYDWWNISWEYRKEIMISNASSDCQMLITVWKEDGYDNVSNGEIDCENN